MSGTRSSAAKSEEPGGGGDKSSSPNPSPSSWNAVSRGRSRTRNLAGTGSGDNFPRGYHSLTSSFGKTFHVEKRWKIIREMGSGAYGFVVSAADEISGEVVAIKLVTRVMERIQLAKRALREITLLRHFSHHENITGLIDVDAISPELKEIYIFMEPMEADLHQIIKSGQTLSNEHVQYFVYQILRGMKYIHSASVVHRDLKPGNLLVNADCELKICDFGLSRGFDSTPENGSTMTERYDTAIDVWSIGCIFAELLLGKPLFKGKDYVDQLNKIIDVLGTPSNATITRICSEKAQAYMRSLPIKKGVPFPKLLPTADFNAIHLLTAMLSFDPLERITVNEALEHPWLSAYHNIDDEPECTAVFDRWREIEELTTLEEFKRALWDEIQDYRREVRGLESSVSTPLQRTGSLLEPPVLEQITEEPRESSQSLSPGDRPASEQSKGGQEGAPAESNEKDSLVAPSDTRTTHSTTQTDPVMTYARRSSIIMQPAQSNSTSPSLPSSAAAIRRAPIPSFADGYFTEDPASLGHGKYRNTIAFPSDGFVMPARSRTGSLFGTEATMPRRLLRTLSTVSIHESGKGLAGGLADIAPIGKFIVERDTADEPASEMPKEFDDGEERRFRIG